MTVFIFLIWMLATVLSMVMPTNMSFKPQPTVHFASYNTCADQAKSHVEIKLGQYLFKCSGQEGRAFFEIWQNGQKVYSEGGIGFRYRVLSRGDQENRSPSNRDFTGDRLPDLVVESDAGGVHCCYTYLIFHLGDRFELLGQIEGRNSHFYFNDLDGDKIVEATGGDDTFTYWRTCYACSYIPQVVLRYREGGYRLATDLMAKPAPSDEEIVARVKEVKEQWANEDQEYSPLVLGYMLDLIYSGNGTAAWRFLEMAWPANKKGKGQFLEEFKEQLMQSPYWPELRAMNGW